MSFLSIFSKVLFFLTFIVLFWYLIAALKNKILFKMSVRNITLRLSTAFLVILGSLVGTALISGSLGVNDSFIHTSQRVIETQLGQIDLQVQNLQKTSLTSENKNFIDEQLKSLDQFESYGLGSQTQVAIQKVLDQSKGEYGKLTSQVTISSYPTLTYKSFYYPGSIQKDLSEFEVAVAENVAISSDLSEGDNIVIYTQGEEQILQVAKVYEPKGLRGFTAENSSFNMLVSEATFKKISPNDFENFYIVSTDYGIEYTEEYGESYLGDDLSAELNPDLEEYNFQVIDRKSQLYQVSNASETSLIFFALSTFGVFAGILLIINLYSMLAEERKSEMGILRAIGMTRGKLVQSFIFEGTIYATIASLLGSLVGVGVGYILVKTISDILAEFLTTFGIDIRIFYDITLESLLISFCAGFLITFITSLYSSFRISKINIVNSIKRLSDEEKSSSRFKEVLKLMLLGLAGTTSVVFFIFADGLSNSSETVFAYIKYLSFIIGSLSLGRLLSQLLKGRVKKNYYRYYNQGITTLASISALAYTTYAINADEFTNALTNSPIFFFLLGLSLVTTLIVLISFNISLLTYIAKFVLSPFRSIFAAVKLAFKYPEVNPARTGLTLAMYGIIIFVIVFISIYRSSLDQSLSVSLENILDGFDLKVATASQEEQEIAKEIILKQESLDPIVISPIKLFVELPGIQYNYEPYDGQPVEQESESYIIESFSAIDEETIDLIKYDLIETDSAFENSDAAWENFFESEDSIVINSLVTEIIDSSDIKVGEIVTIRYPDGTETEKKIFGIFKSEVDNGGYTLGNIFISKDDFNEDGVRLFDLESDFDVLNIQYQVLAKFQNQDSSLSASSDIKNELATKQIFEVESAQELIARIQAFTNQSIYLLQGFLSFSLIIGLAGLGVIMTRSVQERRQQIGMLRSLGFTRGMILLSFILESSLISILGILVGVISGSIGGIQFLNSISKEVDELTIIYPTSDVAILMGIIFIGTLIFTLPPAIKASRLSPVEATNYPE